MGREIVFNENVRIKLKQGIDMVANTVKVTLGPKGRNVLIENVSKNPLITNDGATIAIELELENNIENMGATLIKEVAKKTNELVGDGTTTSIVLAQKIINEGFKNIASGSNPIEIKKGIQGATQLTIAAIRKLGKPIKSKTEVAHIATVSSGDSDLGNIIADALERVGKEGMVTVEESLNSSTTLEVKMGMNVERGLIAPEMATDKEKMLAKLKNPYILITNIKISNPKDLINILDEISAKGRPLLIISEKIEGEALGMLVLNNEKGIFKVVAINPPGYGEGRLARLEDIAVLTGATFIRDDMGYDIKNITMDMLGRAGDVIVEKKNTLILEGKGNLEAIKERMNFIKLLIDKAEFDFDKNQLKERLAKIAGGIAIIKVGATTELEMKEKKLRVEDALNSAKAALIDGIVPGGGTAYIKTIPVLSSYIETLSGDMKTGAEIIRNSLKEPMCQILRNAGIEEDKIISEVISSPTEEGFDVISEEYCNMIENGIVDPTMVVCTAIKNASSVSSVLLTTEAGLGEIKLKSFS